MVTKGLPEVVAPCCIIPLKIKNATPGENMQSGSKLCLENIEKSRHSEKLRKRERLKSFQGRRKPLKCSV